MGKKGRGVKYIRSMHTDGGGLVATSCLTLVTPQTSPPGSSVHGIL